MIKNIKKHNTKAYGYYKEASELPTPIAIDSNVGSTVLWWEEEFDSETIYKLIQDIETVKQSGFNKLTLYFNSVGGDVAALRTLVDYIDNRMGDLELEIMVNGMVASSGFYLLLMITSDITITFDKYQASGLLHLADSLQSGRDMLTKECSRYNISKFYQEHLELLNKSLTTDYLDKLDLSEEDRDRLAQGHDIMLESSELERIVNQFRHDRYVDSDECQQELAELVDLHLQIESRVQYLTGKTTSEFLKEYTEIFEEDLEDEQDTEDNK